MIKTEEGNWLIYENGRLYSIKYKRFMNPSPSSSGYLKTNYKVNGKIKNINIHDLVAKYFIGEKPKGMVVNHRDGNKHNNHVNNLEYIDYKENSRHARRLGLIKNQARGSRIGTSSITESQAKEVITLLIKGERNKDISAKTGVTRTNVCHIKAKNSWKHLWAELEGATTIESTTEVGSE